MGSIKCFEKHKLVAGILTTLPERLDEIINTLREGIGEIDYVSPVMDFCYTDYYTREMGEKIRRVFVSFRKLADPSTLADIKILTNSLEEIYMSGENRKVNFDPGMLCSSRLILASTKDNVHRIPLKNGIYGEVTLVFRGGKFEQLPWTYADFKSAEYADVLMKIREIYKADLKNNTEK